MTTAHPVNETVAGATAALSVGEVEVVVRPFVGFGRLAHLRRQLLELPAVRGARILGYGDGEARFAVSVDPSATGEDLCVPGTRLRAMGSGLVHLAADA